MGIMKKRPGPRNRKTFPTAEPPPVPTAMRSLSTMKQIPPLKTLRLPPTRCLGCRLPHTSSTITQAQPPVSKQKLAKETRSVLSWYCPPKLCYLYPISRSLSPPPTLPGFITPALPSDFFNSSILLSRAAILVSWNSTRSVSLSISFFRSALPAMSAAFSPWLSLPASPRFQSARSPTGRLQTFRFCRYSLRQGTSGNFYFFVEIELLRAYGKPRKCGFIDNHRQAAFALMQEIKEQRAAVVMTGPSILPLTVTF